MVDNRKKCSCHGHDCFNKKTEGLSEDNGGSPNDDRLQTKSDDDKKTTDCDSCCSSHSDGVKEGIDVVSKDLYVRLLADFENFKKRTEKEKENTFLFVERMVLADFLGVVDNFERLLDDKMISKETHDGIGLVYKKMMILLSKFNVSKIDIKEGDLFDESIAESVSSQPVDDEKKDNTVAKKYEDGYKIGNVVLRYAKVVVNKYNNK